MSAKDSNILLVTEVRKLNETIEKMSKMMEFVISWACISNCEDGEKALCDCGGCEKSEKAE